MRYAVSAREGCRLWLPRTPGAFELPPESIFIRIVLPYASHHLDLDYTKPPHGRHKCIRLDSLQPRPRWDITELYPGSEREKKCFQITPNFVAGKKPQIIPKSRQWTTQVLPRPFFMRLPGCNSLGETLLVGGHELSSRMVFSLQTTWLDKLLEAVKYFRSRVKDREHTL